MYRTIRMAAAVAAIILSVEASLASGPRGADNFAAAVSSAVPVAAHVRPQTGVASPNLKKLSPKAGAACFKACMHGMGNSVGWGNFCDAACFGN